MRIAFIALIALITFSGCKKTYINQTVDQAFSALYTIQPGDWVKGTNTDNTNFYSVSLNVAELDDQINTHGGVEVYISFDDLDVTTKTYETVPEVFQGIAYGSIHTTGSVTIDLRAADGSSLSQAITQPITAKIILIDAQPLD